MARTPSPRVAARQDALEAIIRANRGTTVRRLFYIALGQGIYPKSEAGYEMCVEDAALLRDQGYVPYSAIIDPTRTVRHADLWASPADAAEHYADNLRLDPWEKMPCRLAVTVESDGLALALWHLLSDTPLRIVTAKGHTSGTAVHALFLWLAEASDEAVVLHVGDADGQGAEIEADLRGRLALHAYRRGRRVPTVERVWLSREQADDYGLPSRPSKATAMDRKHGYLSECWEAEAGDPATIAALIRERADALLDADVLTAVAEREETAREAFRDLAERLA